MKIPLPKNFNPPPPVKVYDYQDVTVTIFTSKMKLNRWTKNLWHQQQIVSPDWQVNRKITNKGRSLNFSFSSGLQIVIFPRRIILTVKGKDQPVDLKAIINKLILVFTDFDYVRLQIILRRVITFPSNKYHANQFIKDEILNDRKWDIDGVEPLKTQVNFAITDFDVPLVINVSDLPVTNRRIKANSCLFFRGIFDYPLTQKNHDDQVTSLQATIENYESIQKKFNQFIENKILKQSYHR